MKLLIVLALTALLLTISAQPVNAGSNSAHGGKNGGGSAGGGR